MFFDTEKYIYSEGLFITLYTGPKHKFSKKSFGQNKRYKKMRSFLFRELQLVTVLLLTHNSYTS